MDDACITIGLNDATLSPGDHVCVLFRGEEGRDAVLLPFLRAAREEGDKVIAMLEETPPAGVLERLGVGPGADPEAQDTRCFDLFSVDDTYLAQGRFDREELLRLVAERVNVAAAEPDWRYVRAVGDMAWALREAPGVEELARYESDLNRSVWQQGSRVSMCFYDLERFVDGALVMRIMQTHPKVLLNGVVLENPWYLPPVDA